MALAARAQAWAEPEERAEAEPAPVRLYCARSAHALMLLAVPGEQAAAGHSRAQVEQMEPGASEGNPQAQVARAVLAEQAGLPS